MTALSCFLFTDRAWLITHWPPPFDDIVNITEIWSFSGIKKVLPLSSYKKRFSIELD